MSILARYKDRFERPLLFALFPMAGIILVLAFLADLIGWDGGAGFLAIYSLMVLLLGIIGYLSLYAMEYSAQLYRLYQRRNFPF